LGIIPRQNALDDQSWANPRGKMLSTIIVGKNLAAKCSRRSLLGKTSRQNDLDDHCWTKPGSKYFKLNGNYPKPLKGLKRLGDFKCPLQGI
jgi:hypothetical protein